MSGFKHWKTYHCEIPDLEFDEEFKAADFEDAAERSIAMYSYYNGDLDHGEKVEVTITFAEQKKVFEIEAEARINYLITEKTKEGV